jgi:predicted nucleic acid-binding protein
VVDASVWVSRYVPADVNHAASRTWLFGHLSAGNMVIAPTLLLAEVAGALARRTGDSQRAEELVHHLRQLRTMLWVALSAHVRDHAAHLAATQRLRGADAIYVSLADRLKVPLVTWDQEQLKRAGALIAARTP